MPRTPVSLCMQVLRRGNVNNGKFGLAAGTFAKDVDVVSQLSRGLRAGSV